MKSEFWHKCWDNNEIGFHENAPNENLVSHIDRLGIEKGGRWLLPLCGKTLDIGWLVSQGYKVVGIELSELAIQQLFEEMDLEAEISQLDGYKLYQAHNIDIFVGDFFATSAELIGEVDAVFDRGSLVALPKEMRDRYSPQLNEITNKAPQLLVCFDYDQDEMEGPPFSISKLELATHYSDTHEFELASSHDAADMLGVGFELNENVWLLTRK